MPLDSSIFHNLVFFPYQIELDMEQQKLWIAKISDKREDGFFKAPPDAESILNRPFVILFNRIVRCGDR
jgi:hypothetical protein